jgi:hypothetical protein
MLGTELMSQSILQKILRDAHHAALNEESFLAIFDLDSTLFDLTKRIQEIHTAFAATPKWRAKYPKQCEQMNKVLVSPRDWSISEGLERAGLLEKDNPEFYRDIHQHWEECFFSSDYLHLDEPLPGAVEFVRALEDVGARIMYLTGRDVGRMEEGTIKSLKQWKFPLDEEHVELVLKPVAEFPDEEFKAAIIADAAEEMAHVWLFENEPVNINAVIKHCPSVKLVFLDTTHSRREPAPKGLDTIAHFEVDLEAFAKFKAEQQGS